MKCKGNRQIEANTMSKKYNVAKSGGLSTR
jgi:hypothetical protein